jgi:hypothetical protein
MVNRSDIKEVALQPGNLFKFRKFVEINIDEIIILYLDLPKR